MALSFLPPPYPRRYNPVPVIMRILDLTEPDVDPDFEEPIGGLEKTFTELALEAQVAYKKKDEANPNWAGDVPDADGRLVFTKEYLESQGLTLTSFKIGDRIASIGGVAADFRVEEVRPQGHLRGEPHIVFVVFKRDSDKYAEAT